MHGGNPQYSCCVCRVPLKFTASPPYNSLLTRLMAIQKHESKTMFNNLIYNLHHYQNLPNILKKSFKPCGIKKKKNQVFYCYFKVFRFPRSGIEFLIKTKNLLHFYLIILSLLEMKKTVIQSFEPVIEYVKKNFSIFSVDI